MTQPTLTGLVVAHNEENHLPDCLKSLDFCDELIVVLDNCTDNSEAIAQKAGAQIFKGTWPIEGDRRNKGLAACKTDWVLELDADERVTPELAQEILNVIQQPNNPYTYYTLPLDNYIGQRRVRYGWGAYFGTGSVKRLFKRGTKTWGAQRVHPQITFEGKEGPRLTNRLIHYVDSDITDLFNRLNRYTSACADDLLESDNVNKETFGRNVRRLFSRFYKCYVRRKGYKEGKFGFLIALCAGLYPLISYLKAIEKQHVKN